MSEATPKGILKVTLTDFVGDAIPGAAVSIADGADVAQGAKADLVWDGITAGPSLVSIFKKIALSGASAGLTDIQLRAVPVPVSGPLTDAQLRASAVPVSVAALPLPAGAATEATLALPQIATGTAVGALKHQVVGAQANASAPTWTEATFNPLSQTLAGALRIGGTVTATGPLTDAQLRASAVPVTLASTTITGTVDVSDRAARLLGVVASITNPVAVTGTFFQATQPVSLAAAVDVSDRAARLLGVVDKGKIWDGTNTAAVKAASTAAVATDPALVVAVSPNNVIPVSAPTLTKGTQGANGWSVQNLRDAGRNTRIFMLDAFVAAPLVEAVQTVVQWYGNAAVGGTTQPAVVPAGKTLRLTGYKIMYQSLAATGAAVVRIRCNTAGLGVLGSPLVFSFEAGSAAAVAGVMTTETGDFPEGIDIPAAAGLAFSMAGYSGTGVLTLEGTVRFVVYGYEF